MSRWRALLGLLAAAALTVSLPGAATAQDALASPEGVEWGLAAYAAEGGMVAVPEGIDPTLLLAEGAASGNAGCNRFSGTYDLEAGALSFAPAMTQTMMACEPSAQAVEDAYLALLPTTASWQSADGMLQLLDADGTVILGYAAAEPDIATVIALVESLRAEVSDLRSRVEALEAGQAGDGDDGDGTRTPGAPAAPRARGSVETAFPDRLRSGLPPDQVEDKDREVVRWRDRADDEDGFHVYARRGFCQLKPGNDPNQPLDEGDFRRARGPIVLLETLPADSTRYRPDHEAIDEALPDAPASPYSNDQFYDLYVAAYDDASESKRVLVGSFFLTPEFRCP